MLLGLAAILLAALVVAAWSGANPVEHGPAARSLALGALGWVALVVWAGGRWQRSPVGNLVWREGQWHWWPQGRGDAHALTGVDLAWDGQGVVYLRLEGATVPARGLWLERWRDAARWDDLRRAVWAARQAASSTG